MLFEDRVRKNASQQAMPMPTRVFLLSPARTTGKRAGFLLNDRATFDLALKLRGEAGATLGEVFTFLSGLYFRGKLAYASAFARIPKPAPACVASGALVITGDQGLVCASTIVSVEDLRRWSGVDIDADNQTYRTPLTRDAERIADAVGTSGEIVLLGSVATPKFVDPLLDVLGERLLFPAEFVGRGDMSRGGLMLRSARAKEELDYVPVIGALRTGKRPPKLSPMRYTTRDKSASKT
jgi:hypothetical protein